MTVDELLEKNLITPPFKTYCYIPQKGNLRIHNFMYVDPFGEECSETYIYSLTDQSWNLAKADKSRENISPDVNRFMVPDSRLEATGLTYKTIQTDNISLLIKMIKFAEKHFNPVYDEYAGFYNAVKMKPEEICDFCYEFGFPKDPFYYKPITEATKTEEWKQISKNVGLFTHDFTNSLSEILFYYSIWKALYIGDDRMLKTISPEATSKTYMRELIKEICNAELELRIEFQKEEPKLIYHAKNPYELLKAQLTVLISKGDKYFDHGCIAFCEDCGDAFFRRRTNMMYCDKCNGYAGKKRRQRMKKGDQKNG